MTINQIKEILKTEDYNFLKTNPNLNKNMIMLTIGGSHAYGTNNENSDLDIRGCTLNTKRQLLTAENFEHFNDEKTDTTIYSFNKLVSLLSNCNPNTIEMLGNKPEFYFYLSPVGEELLNNKHLFLSKRACYSFGGYANQQLYRLQQKTKNYLSQEGLEQHILKTLQFMKLDFNTRYSSFDTDSINLYIDDAINPDYNKEIFMDINLHHYPIRDYCSMQSEMLSMIKSYNKIGKRNKNALCHDKISKHMMHLIRLYLMCLDILEQEKIVTYREKEHDLLMKIRNGEFIDNDEQPNADFFEMVDEYEHKLEYAKKHTNLPEKPNYKEINDFVEDINERIVKGII